MSSSTRYLLIILGVAFLLVVLWFLKSIVAYILIAAVAAQILFTWQVVNNYRYFVKKHKRPRLGYHPRCILIVPCKGKDETFETNIKSLLYQNYSKYSVLFVVQDTLDPAYQCLSNIIKNETAKSKALSIQILTAGISQCCSQKLHNLLYAYKHIPDDAEILAFADSDVNAGINWLAHLVYPLRKKRNGLSSGYRWFVPEKNNIASLALSAMNAKICQMLGNTRLNLAWGGSMAITVEKFRNLNIEQIWQKALSDDLSISRCVRKAGLKITFVPACLITTYQSSTWSNLWEFGRRQFIITRIYSPVMWLFGLMSSIFSVAGLWGGIGLAIWANYNNVNYAILAIIVPSAFWGCQFCRAIVRQKLIFKLLPQQKKRLRPVRIADIFFCWVWSIIFMIIMLSTIFGRTILWRGIKYKIKSPLNIEILER